MQQALQGGRRPTRWKECGPLQGLVGAFGSVCAQIPSLEVCLFSRHRMGLSHAPCSALGPRSKHKNSLS